mmetsp:Transcript_14181/g.28542  ORF Transcript_14181/g.28542 Transcript_14181/m.28542 type:complete len:276 (-) Transcript_14181:58-885(-)
MSKSALLAKALRKDDDDALRPPPPAPSESTSQQGLMKLRKSNLLGAVTWEDCISQLEQNGNNDYTECTKTITKMLSNVLTNPTEPKFRKIRSANPNFAAKVYSCSGAPAVFKLCGFKDTIEEGFLVLPEAADLSLLQEALDQLAAHAASQSEAEAEKKRKLQEKETAARRERAQKAKEITEPAKYDEAVAGASQEIVQEDEAMVEAIETFVETHPEVAPPDSVLDAFEIERQVVGPGGTVIASVAASAGTRYFDYAAHMTRSAAGAWSVQKMERA